MTTLSKKLIIIFLSFCFSSINVYAVSTSCPGEIITNLNGTSVTATDSDSGTISAYTTYYYTFTPSQEGSIQVDSSVSASYNSLYVLSSCSSTLWQNTANSEDKSSPEIAVAAGQQIVIALERRYSTNQSFTINFTYTVTPPAPPTMGDVPDTTAIIDTSFTMNIADYVTLTNGNPILGYTLTGTLPDGLSFDSLTGVISGTPTTITSASSFTVTATDVDGVSNSDDFTITVQELYIVSSGGRNFALRHQENLFGDVVVLGNTVLCLQNTDGECIESGNGVSNADVDLQKAPESSALLELPVDAVVKYARLYWLGRTDNGWNATTQTAAGIIQFKKDTSTYAALTANIKDAIRYSGDIWLYSASTDVSDIVTGSGRYYVDTSSFYTVTGDVSDGLGTSGSWALVVIYSDPNETEAKNLTIFDGYKGVTSSTDAQASVTGFLTPNSGTVDSTLYVMAAEGDKYLSGTSDQIQMAGATYNTTLQNLGTFDSRIDVDADRTPELDNNNGTDIHKYNVGTANGGAGIITTNEVGAEFNFTSNADVYYPSLFVFSTELYLPQMCYDYSLKQDGQYFNIDRATYPEVQIDGKISSSDIEVGIYLRNEESDLPAQGIAIRTDLNTTIFNQTGNIYTSNVNGSSLINRGTPSYSATLCDYNKDGDNSVSNSGCTDGHNIRKGNGTLGEYQYVYTKFTIQPKGISGIVDMNQSLGMSIKYYITADGSKIEYPDYVLGGINVPICPPTTTYQPQWGQFNVVRSGQAANNITNNLFTQVSRRPFNAVVVFDSTPTTGDNDAPTSDINTTVLVEMIDIDAYGDINASCANPDAAISDSIFVPINFSSTNNQANIPVQDSDYYNFAVKNATFRVWYFDDGNQTLIQDWTATTDSTQRVLSSISGLYNSAVHTVCASDCTSSTSPLCFECIKTNYAQPLCARDNFSVRPESYSLNIYDINQALPIYDIDADPGNLKNTTKVNLSTQTGYAATSALAPIDNIHLAAGYDYRFDINASGNDSVKPAPGYTRVFNGNSDYYAKLLWSPDAAMTGCNDTVSRDVSFYFKNGVVINEERLHGNTGKYILRLIDKTWTAVDWQNLSHHTVNNGFDIGTVDCLLNSSATSGSFYGCTTTTDHGADNNGSFYRDHDLTFHPYKFDLTGIVLSVGLNHVPFGANTYIYMSDMSVDQNMSVHLNGIIKPVGFDNNPLSNFVANCSAVGLDLNLSKSDTTLLDSSGANIVYQSRFHNQDENGTVILADDIDTNETNTSEALRVQTPQSYFIKNLNGSISTINNFNYLRTVNSAVNPKQITLNNYDVNCTHPSTDCMIFADLKNNKTVHGRVVIDQNLTHYYGRTNAPRQRFKTPEGTTGNPARAFIYYEAYCDVATGCNKALLQGGANANNTDDPRWFVNTNHTNDFGVGGNVNKKGSAVGTGEVNATATSGNHQDFTDLVYDQTRGYPYKTTMQNNTSS